MSASLYNRPGHRRRVTLRRHFVVREDAADPFRPFAHDERPRSCCRAKSLAVGRRTALAIPRALSVNELAACRKSQDGHA